jgi:hypothetical protein
MFHPAVVNTPVKKVIYVIIYLRGAAFNWFKLYMKDQLKNGEDACAETL